MGINEKEVNGDVPPKIEDEDCPDGSWSSPKETKPLLPNKAENEEENVQGDKKGLIIATIALLGSIPALIGAWCWPALIIGLISGAVTAGARRLGHYISFGITGGLMLGLNAYILYCCISKRRKLSPLKRFGPSMICFFAMLLIMADLLRHVLQDTGIWPEPGSDEYRSNCVHENITCLTPIGWIFTIVCTYSGFILLFIGTMWNANLIQKLKQIRQKWHQLRHKK